MTAQAQNLPARPFSMRQLFLSPVAWLIVAVCLCALVLSLPVRATIGPMYWDVIVYYDAANRILSGQMPNVDFFAPVGALGYYLVTGLIEMFPAGQPWLLTSWSILPVTVLLMVLVAWEVATRSRGVAMALVIPFLFFSLLPFNTHEAFPVIGSDGFGMYNRQTTQLLYVLVSALLFVKSAPHLVATVAGTVTALFFLKITGFAVGGLICAYGLLAGRISLGQALVVAAIAIAATGLVELGTGLVTAYLSDIRILLTMNSGTLVSRLRESCANNFAMVFFGGALLLVLFGTDLADRFWKRKPFEGAPLAKRLMAFVNLPAGWLGIVLLAGIIFEAQNTGSQAFIFLWPVLLMILLKAPRLMGKPALLATTGVLTAALALPPALTVFERAARTIIGGFNNPDLPQTHLKALGQVNLRPEFLHRATEMAAFYPANRSTYEGLIRIGEYPSSAFFSEIHFQALYLMAIDEAVAAMKKLEADHGIRFDTMMTISFVNPFPWLMERQAPRTLSIGADPFRSIPPTGPVEFAAVRAVDIALRPTCPDTLNNGKIMEFYAAPLADHRRIELTPCYDAYVHPRFASALPG